MIFAAAGALFAWVCALTVAPSLPTPAAGWLYLLGSRICHQIAGRSLHVGEAQLPVCARCYGIYTGAALMTFVWALAMRAGRRARRGDRFDRVTGIRALGAAGLFNVITIGAEWAGWWSTSNGVRLSAGAALGAAAALAVGAAVSKLDYTPWRSTRSPSRDPRATPT